VAHSFFFTDGSLYLVLFDCSIELDDIVNENKLIYWLNFLESQIESKNKILLIGTKVDILEKQYTSRFGKLDTIKFNGALQRINESRKKNFKKIFFF
jgi:hypothetical protein